MGFSNTVQGVYNKELHYPRSYLYFVNKCSHIILNICKIKNWSNRTCLAKTLQPPRIFFFFTMISCVHEWKDSSISTIEMVVEAL